MIQTCNRNSKVEKTCRIAAGLFLFLSIFVATTNAHASNTQDEFELEAFYNQVFGKKIQDAPVKSKQNKNLTKKDSELEAFYGREFGSGQTSTNQKRTPTKKVTPRSKRSNKTKLNQTTKATHRPLTKSTPKAIAVKRKNPPAAEKLQRLITDSSNKGRVGNQTKAVSLSKNSQRKDENSASNTGVEKQAIADKDPELVAFYHQVFGKDHTIQAGSSVKTKVQPSTKKSTNIMKTTVKTKEDNSQTYIAEATQTNSETSYTTNITTVPKTETTPTIQAVSENTASKTTSKEAKLQSLIDDLKPNQNGVNETEIKSAEEGGGETESTNTETIPSISQNTYSPAIHAQQIEYENVDDSEESDDASSGQSDDLSALFAKAFGKKAEALPSQINVEIRINKEVIGDVVVYSNKKKTRINKVGTDKLLASLEEVLKDHVFERTKGELSKQDKVTFKSLKKLGIVASYNPADLSLDLQIDSALRKPQILTIRKRLTNGFAREENKIEASEASGYLNLYSNLGVTSGGDPNLKLKLESSFNLRGVTLENSSTYIDERWTLGNTSLTYDDPDKLKRYIVGDISAGNRNFQENFSLQGVRVSKEFFMDPELQLNPSGTESFVLETDSEVEVYLNNYLQQRYYLKKGIYSLKDIGLSHGENNIRVRIKDEFGKVTEKTSQQFYDSQLLKPGLAMYAVSLGVLDNREDDITQFDSKNDAVLTGYYLRGLSKTVTISVDAQISPDSYLLGTEIIASVPLGSIKHSLGISGGSFNDTGYASRFEFRPNIKRQLVGLDTLRQDMLELDTSIGRFISGWSISGEYKNKDFSMINEVLFAGDENKKLKANLQTQFGINLGNDWRGSVGLIASEYYDSDSDLSARITANKSFNNGMRLSIGANYDTNDDFSVNMQLTIPLSRERHKRRKEVQVTSNSKDNSYGSRYIVHPKSILGKDSLSGSLEYKQTDNQHYESLDLNYSDTRFDALLNAQNYNKSQNLNIGLNSSLLCVGKNCAISRPVNDSFALVSGPSNQKEPIAIKNGNSTFRYSDDNDSGLPDNYTALIPNKGSHAVVAIDSYRFQRINIDEATLPSGYDTEKTEFEVFPRYHQGFLIKAGGEPATILDGILIDQNKKPLGYKGGQWVSMTEEGKTIAFFSNKAGRFRITSIPAGKYTLELFDYPDMQSIEINVPDKKGEVFNTGNLLITE